ncbi:MAG: hypothetical protein EOL87_02865 [Spartobacteria bacterium]|nr:hypothetical protein [Spartobacteria bacterium]
MKNRVKRDCLSYYHCMSRIVGRAMLMGDVEKEHMRRLIRRVEGFTGVKVLTYAVMTNHFHLLLKEPERHEPVSDEELDRRLASLYKPRELTEIYLRWQMWRDCGMDEEIELDRQRYRQRMHDISEFVRQIKHRFTCWYNRRNERVGTVWQSRFKSVMVEDGYALRVVAAYIEMNPVRAGMVEHPELYRFGGLGEAECGGVAAQRGIKILSSILDESVSAWDGVRKVYCNGILRYCEAATSRGALAGVDAEVIRERMRKRQKITDFERLLCSSRYFTDAQVLGGEEFVEEYYKEFRTLFCASRKSGPRKVKGGWNGLYSVRTLGVWT